MRFDMHCHTKEGSLDGKIELSEYVRILKNKGFDGMLLTDHNSYQAYRYYQKHKKDPIFQNFVVLKGIEYDTIDAGHILVVMPSKVKLPILELRGLSVSMLIEIVHFFGGILGPAHPCGEKYLSFCNTRCYRKNPDILKSFDFMETFNACEVPVTNVAACKLAEECQLPAFGGSDAHKSTCVGLGYTDFFENITSEDALIQYVKQHKTTRSGGEYYHGTTKERIGSFNDLLVYSFWFYNKAAGFAQYFKRRLQIRSFKKTAGKLS